MRLGKVVYYNIVKKMAITKKTGMQKQIVIK